MMMGARRGFSLIELIFTIILLGIIFATVASLLLKSVELDIASLEGEALYRAAALMNRITSQPHNSALWDELNTTTGNEPTNKLSIDRIVLYTGIADPLGGAFQCLPVNDRRGETTINFENYTASVGTTKSRLCSGSRVSRPGADPFDNIVAPPPAPAPAAPTGINEWNGYIDDHDRFILTVSVKPFEEPDPRPAPPYEANATVDWGNLADKVYPSPLVPSNLLLITVTATAKDMDEPIGELNYIAANIGAAVRKDMQ